MKEIEYAPGYFITEDGKVWSFKDAAKKGRVLRAHLSTGGYRQVTLSVKGKPLYRKVSRLVAEAYCEKPDGTYLVRHLDGDQLNDRADNLRWGTQLDNARDRAANGRQAGQVGADHFGAKLNVADVLTIRNRYDAGERPCIIALDYPITAARVTQIGLRKGWKSVPEEQKAPTEVRAF
jgi:hypothetical protein